MKRIALLPLLALAVMASATDVNTIARAIAETNPGVVADPYTELAAVEEMRAENVLPDPSVELEQLWGTTAAAGNKLALSVSQEFSFPTLYKRRAKAADAAASALDYLQLAEYLDVALNAKLTILELIYTRQSIEALTRISNNLDSLEALNETAFRGGEITVLDRNKLRIEGIGVRLKLTDLSAREIELVHELNTLAGGRDVTEAVAGVSIYPLEPMLSLDEYQKLAAEYDPTIRYNQADADAKTLALKALSAERLPGFSLGYTYNREGPASDIVNFHGFNFSMSLPLYSASHRKQAIMLEREQALSDNHILEIKAANDMCALYSTAHTLRHEIDAFAPVIDDTDNFKLLDEALAAGQINLIDYLQEVNYFIDAQMSLIETRYNYASAMAKLNRFMLIDDAQ